MTNRNEEELRRLDEVYENHSKESRNVELQYEYERRKLGEMYADYGIKTLRDLSEEMEKMKEDLTRTRLDLKLMTQKWDMNLAEIWDDKNNQNIHSEEYLARQESVVFTRTKQQKLKVEIDQLKLNRSDLREELEDLKEKLVLKGSKIPFSKSPEIVTLNQELSAFKALSIVFKEELVRLDEQNKILKSDLKTINKKYGWAHHLLERRNFELQYEYERRKLGEMCADYGIKALRDLSEEMEKMKEDLTRTRDNLKLMTLKWDMDIAEIWDNKNHQNIHSEESLARQESVVSTESGFFGPSSSSPEAFKEELASLDEENENLKTDFTTINSEYVMAYHLLESRNAERQYECQRQKLGEMCAVYGIKALFYLSKEMEKVKDELARVQLQLKLTAMKWDTKILKIWDNKIYQNL
ncbi:hypothetical protein QYM36_008997 [Artemia franciscana]|uniref:Uncharacterized protein n=1 Tax=Artemia franciscana TaxID=6661 RepID=A0AA88HVC6_ARTSF|nr:hypothetical protein QYM36_008997 [Artemia franciscana]